MLETILKLYMDIRSAAKDKKLSPAEINKIMNGFGKVLEDIAEMLPDKKVSGLVKGIGSALDGIGDIVESPKHGVDDLIRGLGELMIAIADYLQNNGSDVAGVKVKGLPDGDASRP